MDRQTEERVNEQMYSCLHKGMSALLQYTLALYLALGILMFDLKSKVKICFGKRKKKFSKHDSL